MPNAILRAGPFASSSDSFLDKPDPAVYDIFPVNCANDTSSSTWPWRYNKSVNKLITRHTGCEETPGGDQPTTSVSNTTDILIETADQDFSISEGATSNYITSMTLKLGFMYQAVESFNIKITFAGLAEASAGLPAGSVFFEPGPLSFFDSQSEEPVTGFPSIGDSVTRTLPAAVVPASYSAVLELNSGIDFPTDICTPNSGSANVSGTLEIEFL